MGFYEVKSKTTKAGVKIRTAKSKVARKVPVAYTVKNGITRLVWEESEGEIVAGTMKSLETGRHSAAAGNVGDWIVVAGGVSTHETSATERFYKNLGREYIPPLTDSSGSINAASTSNYVLFVYEYTFSSKNHIDAFNLAFTKTSLSLPTYSQLRYSRTGSLDGKAFVFDIYGGELSIIDDSLAEIGRVACSAKTDATAVSMDNHIIVAGSNRYTDVIAIDSAGTATTLASLDAAKYDICGAYTGKHVILAAGLNFDVYFNDVVAYDTALTKKSAESLAVAKSDVGAARLGNRAIFAGGYTYIGAANYYSDAVSYDGTLTQESVVSLYRASRQMACGSVGEYALFMGGSTASKIGGDTPINVYMLQ